MDALGKDIKAALPEPGASLSFSFLTERGTESYDYDWTKSAFEAEPAPLTLRNHVGGTPILALIGRSKGDSALYQKGVKWLKVIHGHAADFLLPQLPEGPKEVYEQASKVVYPLLKRLDDITGKMLLPALADGQAAFVLDAKWTSKQWHQQVKTPVALPLPEVGLVVGVSDAALLRKAMAEYRQWLNDALAAARSLSQEQVPEIQIPAPESEKKKAGTLYFYPVPEALGLDPQVTPAAGLSQRVAVLALSKEHAEALLTRKPLEPDGGPLADPQQPLLEACYFDWNALMTAVTPWVEFGVRGALPTPRRGVVAQGPSAKEVLEQVRAVIEVLKVYRGSTSATYREGGARVTHSESVVRDLE